MEEPSLVSAEEGMEGGSTVAPSSAPPPVLVTMKPSLSSESTVENQAVAMANNDNSPALSSPPVPVTMKPSLSSESTVENQAVTMANNDNTPALSSPAEASPAKPAIVFSSITNGTIDTSPTSSDIASASDSLTSAEMSLVNTSIPTVTPPLPSACPSATSSDPVPIMEFKKSLPHVLTFKGITVSLENNSVWKQFHSCGTEMILTKQGRRMFPYCRYRLAGLEPMRRYSLVLSITPADQHKYRWSTDKWEVSGPAEYQSQGLIRAFSHHHSPCTGAEWMESLVSFYKLKLTNNSLDQEGHMILHSMHRYIPRLHVIPVLDGEGPTPEQPLVKGPESLTFTFPQTEFFAVTSYQNLRITRLKINHNPFARGFRDDGHSPRLGKPRTEAARAATQSPTRPSRSDSVISKDVVDLSTKRSLSISPSDEEEAEPRAKQKKVAAESSVVTDASASEEGMEVENSDGDHLHRQHLRAQLALPPRQLSLDTRLAPKPEPSSSVEPVKSEVPSPPKALLLSPKEEEESQAVRVTPKVGQPFRMARKPSPATPTSSLSTPALSPGCVAGRKRRRRINRHWGNSRGRDWRSVAVASTPASSPSVTVAMQPELDDVEGLLFVSFTSKEALGIHVEDVPASSSSPVSPTPQPQPEKTVEEVPETDEEKISRLEAVLLQDLGVLKHRQVIHPVLQEVGLKLSSLDPTQAIDLQYLGVRLPLPPLVNAGQANTKSGTSSTAGGLAFVSRTGKTSDLTKIKGWRDKFIKNKQSSAQHATPLKNLSAFCSNMLDEYLESEAYRITERADAFSTNSDSTVAYQLPAKSSSYVKTLDSALKHRSNPPKLPPWPNRPCPLSRKPHQYSIVTIPPRPLTGPPKKMGRPKRQSASEHTNDGVRPIAPKPWQGIHPVKEPKLKARAKVNSGTKDPHGASPASQGSPSADPGASQKSGKGVSNSRPSGLSKFQVKLMEMEKGALNLGLNRTHLTPNRLSVALSVILTAKTLPRERFSVPLFSIPQGPACGKEFCRLGCVCSSLQRETRGPLHCRRPDCMLGCACFKRKITKQASAAEPEKQAENQTQTVYSVSNIEHEVQPSPGSHSGVLWDKTATLMDPEPIFTPKPSQDVSSKQDQPNKRYVPRLNLPVREEDKCPIYKYFESMMTCARVREFKGTKVGPQSSPPAPALSPKEALQKILAISPKKTPNTVVKVNKKGKAGKPPPQDRSKEQEPGKQVEIQSECKWDEDRKMILGGLCRRMNQNRLSMPFHIGPYLIRLISKRYTRKTSSSIITYKVRISKPNKSGRGKGGKSDDGDDEVTDNSSDEVEEAVKEDDPPEEPEMQVGVTPFLSGILPAGKLSAQTKPSGGPTTGLIQVNGKSYTQARLLLGSMGSLHPANRLAAYVTGRLRCAGRTPPKDLEKLSPKADSVPMFHTQDTMRPPGKTKVQMGPKAPPAKAHFPLAPPTPKDLSSSLMIPVPVTPLTASDISAGSPLPVLPPGGKKVLLQPITTAQGARLYRHPNGQLVKLVTKKQMTQIKPKVVSVGKSPGQPFRPNILRKGLITTPHHSRTPSATSPLITFITGPHGSIIPAQKSSSPSSSSASLSLTVSPTLKTPSFLGQSGTYSFRICPPPANQSSSGPSQSPPGRTLPGGFTLIQLPKPCHTGATVQPARPVNSTNSNMMAVPVQQKRASSTSNRSEANGDTHEQGMISDRTHVGAKYQSNARSSELSSAPDLACDEKIQSDESDDAEKCKLMSRMESDPDMASEDYFLDSDSDEQGDRDINDDSVDIETVEEARQRNTIDEMRAAARRLLSGTQDSSEDSGSAREHRVKGLSDEGDDESEGGDRRRNHKVTERLRRTEQRHLFNRLQTILHVHDAPKLRLLSLAVSEIQNLVGTSKCLERQKKRLKEMQSVYVKEISRLSGRSEEVVKTKLREICESRKAMVHSPPILRQRHQTPKSQARAHLVKPQPRPPPPTQSQPQPETATASVPVPVQVIEPQSQPVDRPQAPPPPPTVPGPSPSPLPSPAILPKSAPLRRAACISPSSMALPLVRSKTGRIILPSSLRPAGQGYYTLKVMKPDMEGEERKAGEGEEFSGPQAQPSELDSSKDGERMPSECERLSEEAENPVCHGTTKEEKTSSLLNNTGRLNKKSPLAQIARLNSAIWKPQVALQTVESMNGGTMLVLGRTETTACLSFNPGTRPMPVQPKLQETGEGDGSQPVENPSTVSDASPPVVRRGRGRPRKYPLPQNVESKPVEKAEQTPAKQTPAKQTPSKVSPAEDSPAEDSPAPVKRGRGRPPKKKKKKPQDSQSPADGTSPGAKSAGSTPAKVTRASSSPVTRAGGSAAKAKRARCSPTRSAHSPVNTAKGSPDTATLLGDISATRPVTRGALGKDFPSAKKRSWIDIENEIDSD